MSDSHEHDHLDASGKRLGMWLFLFTEVMLFAVLFIIYSVYRSNYFEAFQKSAHHLSLGFGTVNTVLLLFSSMTMVFSIIAIQRKNEFLSQVWILITMTMGVVFLGNKYLEWYHKIYEGIYPNSEVLLEMSRGEVLFYGLYFLMTGIHALHIIIGLVLLSFAGYYVNVGRISPKNPVMLENFGLYWHLVDIIWIFLFPLFYLIG